MDVTPSAPALAALAVDPFGVTLEQRVLAAARECIATAGLRETTVDDIAVTAGCSRATVYRLFPGGRRGLLSAMVHDEVETMLQSLADTVDRAADLSDAVTAAVALAAGALAEHPVLQRSLVEDPGAVLPYISFDGAAPLYARVAAWGRDHLARFVPPDQAEAVGEWAARLVLGHLHQPSARIDLTDPACTRHIVDTYLVPGLRAGALAV